MENGLLGFLKTPEGQGLLSSVAGYAAGARRGTPINNIGRGLTTGLMGYQNANDQIRQDKENAFQRQYRGMQMDEMRGKITDQTAMREAAAQAFQASRTPAQAAIPAMFGVGGNQGSEDVMGMVASQNRDINAMSEMPQLPEQVQQTQAPQAASPGGFDPVAYRQNMFAQMAGAGNPAEAMKWAPPEAKVAEPYSLSPGQVRFGADGKQLAAVPANEKEGPQALGQDMREWLAVNGIDPKAATPQQLQAAYSATNQQKDRRAPKVDVRVGGSTVVNEAQKTAGRGLGEYAIDLRKNSDAAYKAADEVNYVVDSLQGYGGGPLTEFKAAVGKYAPNSDWGKLASVKELADTVQAKLAPSMRAAGSGATSDFEMKMWMKAVPTLATTEQGRELMRKYTGRVAERAAYRAEIETQMIETGNLSIVTVNQKMKDRFGDKFLDPSDAKLINGGKQATQTKDLPKKQPGGPQDTEAVKWARSNPNDPRAAKILRLNGK